MTLINKKQSMFEARTECSECGHIFAFWRRQGKRKKIGHIKHVFCVMCNRVTAHSEISYGNQM